MGKNDSVQEYYLKMKELAARGNVDKEIEIYSNLKRNERTMKRWLEITKEKLNLKETKKLHIRLKKLRI